MLFDIELVKKSMQGVAHACPNVEGTLLGGQ